MEDLFKPLSEVLPSDFETDAIKRTILSYADTLEKLLSIGTHLYDWEKKDYYETTLLHDECTYVLISFRRILELLDSISIQLKAGSIDPAFAQLRALFELCVQFEYLIDTDTQQKGYCILLCDTYRNLERLEKIKLVDKNESDLEYIQHLRSVIELPELSDLKVKYDAIRYNKRLGEIKWYGLYDEKLVNFARLIKKPDGITDEPPYGHYSEMYSIVNKEIGNDIIHSTNLLQGKLTVKDGVVVLPSLRRYEGARSLACASFYIIKQSFEKISLRRDKAKRSLYIKAIMRCEKDNIDVAFGWTEYMSSLRKFHDEL